MDHAGCPFCQPIPKERILCESATLLSFSDGFPVAQGHTLVIPKRHVASLFDLSESEYQKIWVHVMDMRTLLADKFHPAGFNIGVNDGRAAGQTVIHAHIHIIPRYEGDLDDPRGGIRWVLPAKAKYW
jgi:diadenosine tetraphosphate (Ap4A) HIT family hydrolase